MDVRGLRLILKWTDVTATRDRVRFIDAAVPRPRA
jgi:hypothetical protein